MPVPYERTGRTGQKARTREALVLAARDLVGSGRTPTVEEAAAAARISRTTAYRYFPNQRSLLVAAHPEIDLASLLGDDPPADPTARWERTLDALIELTLATEPQLRTMLRLSLERGAGEEDLVLRRGRAIGWFEEALEPLRGRLSNAELRRLTLAARAACGIESLVWLTDVAGLSPERAAETMRWSGRALLRAALDES